VKTQYYTASSLDGFIATEDHSLEWLFQLGDINDTSYPEFIKEVGALAMGSSTYEWDAAARREVGDGSRRGVALCSADLGVVISSHAQRGRRPHSLCAR